MSSRRENKISPVVFAFAPSRPPSTSCSASDYEHDPNSNTKSGQRTCFRSSPFITSASSSSASEAKEETVLRKGTQLSKSEVDRAFALVQASWKHEEPDVQDPAWHVLHISPVQLQELRDRLRSHETRLLAYFEDDLRYDYNPDREALILRLMTTALHESLQTSLITYLISVLASCVANIEDSILRSVISKIKSVGNARVWQGNGARRCPDGQFRLLMVELSGVNGGGSYRFRSRFPQFVMEIGYSQKSAALPHLAKDYYEISDGKIKTVLTINIDYRSLSQRKECGDHAASFCLYRGPTRIHHNTIFRTASGSPISGSLKLLLTDFIPDQVLERLGPDSRRCAEATTFEIDFQQLCGFLEEAEDLQEMDDGESSQDLDLEPGSLSKKRKTVDWVVDSDEYDKRAVHDGQRSSSDSPEPFDRSRGSLSRPKRRRTSCGEDKAQPTTTTGISNATFGALPGRGSGSRSEAGSTS